MTDPFNHLRGARAEVAMVHRGLEAGLAQRFGQPFGRVDRTVPPARAAHRYVDVALALRAVTREQVGQE